MTKVLNKLYALTLITLSLLFILILPSVRSNAASTSFQVTTANKVHPGDTFSVSLSVSGNTGISGFDLKLHYSNTSLTLINVKYSDYFEKFGSITDSDSTSAIPYSIAWADKENWTQNSSIAVFTFRLNPGAKLEKHDIYVTGEAVSSSGKELALSFVGGGVYAVCAHDTDASLWEKFNYTEATCTSPSITYYRCTECLQQKTELGTQTLAHSYVKYDHKDATCEENGYDREICSKCQTVITTKVYESLGHKYSSSSKVVAPTCLEKGYTLKKCTVCNVEVKTNFTEKISHDMKESSRLEPTCTNIGYIRYKCTVCNYQTESVLETVPHDHVPYEVIEPTHFSKGYTVYKCKFEGCTHSYTDDYTDQLEHVYAYTPIEDPTCTEKGFKVGRCIGEGCNATHEVELDPTGHSFDDWKTVTQATRYHEGFESCACRKCGLTKTRTIPMIEAPNHHVDQVAKTPPNKIVAAITNVTDANHPAIIALVISAVVSVILCAVYTLIKLIKTR